MNSTSSSPDQTQLQFYQQIERCAFNTWPAATNAKQGDWVMRVTDGITKRANSIWTGAGNSIPNGNWLMEGLHFYQTHGLPVRYHISDASPVGLDALLEREGFLQETPCSVLIADTEQVISRTSSEFNNLSAEILSSHSEQWLADFIEMEGFDKSKLFFYDSLFSRITQPKCFCTLEWNGQCAAVGTAVVEAGWAGLTNIAVKSELRGQEIGKRLLNELASWSMNNGAQRMYLQVVNDNEPAHRLYQKAGFTSLFQFHYRVQP
ncbi:Acetyltransferase (GNAT) family protein [Paenibacillus sp. 1_12]|uniref:GNAT family N-acetyltransferase n=1 Tax=Paenibacillus sp. 1_12 TaxID=1566278 RepID=UPI0008DEDE64|nr:GNAT family N-acetyltransferase [Paenibacillus sp. 1_12]SFL84341.1 Acetyltransferase (GNAT) family protein [Paenibacillus sp. 1_12]